MHTTELTGGSRVERKKEETKKKIITIAMNLIKQQGLAATTMEQIARETDIAKGTLYNYFRAKEAIIDEYIKQSFKEKNDERISRLVEMPDTKSRMSIVFSDLFEGVQANKDFFEKYIVYRMQNMVSFDVAESEKSGLYLIAAKIIELGEENAEIRNDLPFFILEDLFEFAFVEVVKQFYMEPEKFNAAQAIEQCVALFLNAVKP